MYTCPSNHNGKYVSDAARTAVASTAGKVMTWNGRVSAGFFVAGSRRDSSSCRGIGDPTRTERFVTYNLGNIGDAVEPSSIGNRSNPDNRGCMSQNLANCLDSTENYDYKTILRYFYGSDVVVGTAHAPAMSDAAAVKQSQADTIDGACYSDAFDRFVALDECIQSGAQRQWYQCRSDGSLRLVGTHADGSPNSPRTCSDVAYY